MDLVWFRALGEVECTAVAEGVSSTESCWEICDCWSCTLLGGNGGNRS